MRITEIKKKMMEWEDFYGGDIFYTAEIRNAKTKKALADIMETYSRYLEDQAIDAQTHFEGFVKELGLERY